MLQLICYLSEVRLLSNNTVFPCDNTYFEILDQYRHKLNVLKKITELHNMHKFIDNLKKGELMFNLKDEKKTKVLLLTVDILEQKNQAGRSLETNEGQFNYTSLVVHFPHSAMSFSIMVFFRWQKTNYTS